MKANTLIWIFFQVQTVRGWHAKKEKNAGKAKLTGVKNKVSTFFVPLEPHGSSNSKPQVQKIYGLKLQNYKIKFSGNVARTGDGPLQQPLMQAINPQGGQKWVRY